MTFTGNAPMDVIVLVIGGALALIFSSIAVMLAMDTVEEFREMKRK